MAAIVNPELFQEFLSWRQQTTKTSLSQAFKELQQLCAQENYSLEIPARSDRDNPFTED
ncbi:hypothetical protein [Plectonema radiosum]|uniref:hypothetical protein n=1 Tax=Plectonema radiosum TaxID=945768 RepID=UPI001D14F4D0|nr:hypothetical protein [Plectonema radiosum]